MMTKILAVAIFAMGYATGVKYEQILLSYMEPSRYEQASKRLVMSTQAAIDEIYLDVVRTRD